MKKVNVLMSTYNGERYLQEQIDSILNQTYPNIEIFVRDDGSKDRTLEILQDYQQQGKLSLIQGENIGFVKSFLNLLDICPNADFYAFSDQDDIWNEDKVENAVNVLENMKENFPNLYCGNFTICDVNMNEVKIADKLFVPFTIEKTIVNGQTGFGFTQVFNHKAREYVCGRRLPDISRVFGHDTWMHLLCLCFGNVFYDEQSCAKYRRHDNNVSNQEYRGGNIISHQAWRIKQFLLDKKGKQVYLDAKEFLEIYNDVLSPGQKAIFSLFINEENNVRFCLKKALYKNKMREKMWEDFALRLLFLLNRM